MAAPAGAAPAPSPPRSFADVVSNSAESSIPIRPPEKFKGMPAVSFSDQDIQILAQKFKFALIGKFSKGRPPMVSIRKTFELIGFGGHFSLGLIDQKHILINFDLEEDYQRCWLRKSWSIQGFIMNIFKWSPDFRPEVESPIVPVWVAFEGLPVHLQDKRAVYSIANIIGTPLKVDASTLSVNRPSVARVCVELNVTKNLPQTIWINNGSYGGFAQAVKYEYIPPYCSNCNKFGHTTKECRSTAVNTTVHTTSQMPEMPRAPTANKPRITSEPATTLIPPRKRWQIVSQAAAIAPSNIENDNPHFAGSNENTPNSLENDDNLQDSGCSESFPECQATLGTHLIDDHCVRTDSSHECVPGHYSDGDDLQDAQVYSKSLLESWKEASKGFSAKLCQPDKDAFVTVTKKKRRPRKDYSAHSPSVTTRLAAGKIARVSFSHRLK